MARYRIARNEWNVGEARPWRGAIGIEDMIDPDLAVPPVVCWFSRGVDDALPERVVALLNEALDPQQERERQAYEALLLGRWGSDGGRA